MRNKIFFIIKTNDINRVSKAIEQINNPYCGFEFAISEKNIYQDYDVVTGVIVYGDYSFFPELFINEIDPREEDVIALTNDYGIGIQNKNSQCSLYI